ncbi:MAG: DUF3078 domain-containing protein [Bacteroidaceae bacterium]|jgi:hypothetical protein
MKVRLLHIFALTALTLGLINPYASAEEYREVREKPCIFLLKDTALSEKALALFPDSLCTDSLALADSVAEVPKEIMLDPAYYKLYLPFTFYDDALMQWSPSKLLRGKYDEAEHNFRMVCEELYNDSLRAQAALSQRNSPKSKRRRKPAYSSVTKKKDTNPFQSIVDSLRAAEMQIQAYKLTLQAQKTSKEFYYEWLTEGTPRLEYDRSTFRHFALSNAFLNSIFYELYYSEPEIIEKWSYKIDTLKVYKVAKEELVEPKVSIAELFRPEPVKAAPRKNITGVKLVKPSFWNFSASSSLQFSQLYVSDNWYKGGENNLNLQSYFIFKFNYNNRKKIQWDNTLEIKEGFNTTSSDTLRNIHMNNDLLRYTGKIGLQAISNWYYTISTQFSTQLFNGYPTNSDTRTSGFLSPAYLSIGIGMDYKLNKSKLNLSVVLAPLNYDLKFVKDAAIEETQYGIEDGKFALHTYGSKITSTFDWQIFSFVKYTSRFEGFTNYERTEGSWENTLDFFVNRYIKASLFWHIRFDDNVYRAPGESYFQYYELFSFGLTYDW